MTTTTPRKPAPNAHTPWGWSQAASEYAPGIVLYSTASHGGFELSPARYAELPAELRAMSFTGNRWFEEDCSAVAVALQWPELFAAELVADAHRTARAFYPEPYARWSARVHARVAG